MVEFAAECSCQAWRDVGFDHQLLMAEVGLKIGKGGKGTNDRVRFDVSKLRDPETRDML